MPSSAKLNLRDRVEDGNLDLSMSDLDEVPVKEIALIKKAVGLDLANNRLATLPKSFCSLTHLVRLDLSKNQLRELPPNFGDLVLLKHLDLYSNQLSHLPLTLGQLKLLKWLDLKNNPLVPALAQVAGPCLDTKQCQDCARKIVGFLHEMQVKVEQEKQKRLLEKQRQQESAELAAQNQKKEQQQKKKKKAKTTPNATSPAENGLKVGPGGGDHTKAKQKKSSTHSAAKQKQVSKKSSGFFGQFLKVVLTISTISTLGLLLLWKMDPERFDVGRKVIAEALPPAVLQMLTDVQQLASLQLGAGYKWLSTDTTVQHYVNVTVSLWELMCVHAGDAYRTVNEHIPLYVDAVKKKIL